MQPASLDLTSIDAIVFDVIGTLVDEDASWATAARRLATESGLADGAQLQTLWAAHLEHRMDAIVHGTAPWQPHGTLVSDAAREAITTAGGTPSGAALAFVQHLDSEYAAWPDVEPATAALRQRVLVAGVSNGDLHSLARLANINAISWDIALSTGAARTFKPDPAAYQYAIDTLELTPARTLFVAAHPWDLRAAAAHGFRTAYVARAGAELPRPEDRFDLEVDNLTVLASLLAGDSAAN